MTHARWSSQYLCWYNHLCTFSLTHRKTTITLSTEQVTTTQVEDNRSPINPLWASEFTLFLVRDAPTWGPQPWHGYSIAVWFSSGPWSKQTSFALLLRSCRNRKNITHQSSSGGAAAAQLPFHHVMVPATQREGQGHPMWTTACVCKAIPLAEPFSGCRGHQSCVCDPHPHSSPSPAWRRISGNIWTKKHWSAIGFPKWASAPTLVLITLGITGQLLSSLLTQRHGKQSSKSTQRPFHHAELQQYLFVYSKNIYWMQTRGQAPSVSERTFGGTEKSPLICPPGTLCSMWMSIPPTTLQSQPAGKRQCWPSPCTWSPPDYVLHGNQTNWVNQEVGFMDRGEVAPELNAKRDR